MVFLPIKATVNLGDSFGITLLEVPWLSLDLKKVIEVGNGKFAVGFPGVFRITGFWGSQ